MWIDASNCVDVVLFDFAKVFDRVCHSVLIEKLHAVGIRGSLLSWLGSFLVGRLMRVSVSGSYSGLKLVLSGVPQGSVLGPLLFLIYVNDLPFHIRSKCKVFADDFKIYLSAKLTDSYLPSKSIAISICHTLLDFQVVSDSYQVS